MNGRIDRVPRLLFPFAREIIATAVRNGGFPPLLLDPWISSVSTARRWRQQPAQAPRAGDDPSAGVRSVLAPQCVLAEARHKIAVRRKFGFA